MPGTTVRISEETRTKLREIAAQTGQPMQKILEQAIEEYRRRRFLDDVNRAYEALRNDPTAWAEELEERAAWDATISDGLDP